MKFEFNNYLDAEGNVSPVGEEDLGFFGTLGDIAMAPVRGVAGAAEGVYDLADWALMDWLPDAEDNFGLGHSETLAGGLVEGVSQFLTGFIPGMGALSIAGKATGIASKLSSASKTTKWAASFGKSVTAGAMADFAVFDAQEQRLSNLLQQYPSLQNPVSEFLAADENDTEIEGRLKNLMEGGILGGMMEPFVIGLRAIKSNRAAKARGMTPEEAAKEAIEKNGLRKQTLREDPVEEAAIIDDVIKDLGLPEKEALALQKRMLKAFQGKRPGPVDEVDIEVFAAIENELAGAGIARSGRKRGADTILSRLELAANKAKASGDDSVRYDVEDIRTFMNEVGVDMFDEMGVSIHKKLGAQGRYEFGSNLIRISQDAIDNGSLVRTSLHEMWHGLSRHLPKKDLKALESAYAKAVKKQDKLKAKGKGATGDEAYRFTSIDEWFAETLTDVSMARLDYLENAPAAGTVRAIFDDVKLVLKDVITYVQSKLGILSPEGVSEKIYRDFVKGKNVKKIRGFNLDAGLQRSSLDLPNPSAPKPSKADLARRVEPNFTTSVKAIQTVRAAMDSGEREVFENYKPMTFDELEAGAEGTARFWAEATGQDPRAFVAQTLDSGKEFMQRQAVLRDIADMWSLEAKDLAQKVSDDVASDDELIHAEQLMMMAKELVTGAREGGTLAGQTLAAQKRVAGTKSVPDAVDPARAVDEPVVARPAEDPGAASRPADEATAPAPEAPATPAAPVAPAKKVKTEEGSPQVISENMYRGPSDEARQFRHDYLEAVGGGSVEQGRKVIKRRVQRMKKVQDAQGPAAALSFAKRTASMPHMLTEYWMNSILSGPVTHLVNMTSNTIHTFFRPFEKALGEAATFNFQGAFKELSFYMHLGSQLSDATKAAASAWKNWGDELDNIGKFDTDRGFDRAISAKNFNRNSQDMGGAAIDWIGKALNLPSRMLMAEDAFFKHLNYRAEVKAGLSREGVAAGKKGTDLARHIEEGMEQIINNGQFYNYKSVRMAAERHALDNMVGPFKDPTDKAKAMKQEIARFMDSNWDEGRGAIADKAREYGREITFTRSLDDPDRAALVKVASGWNKVVNDHPFLRIVTPFVRTPTNLVAFFLNRTSQAYADVAKGMFVFAGNKVPIKAMNRLSKEVADSMAKGGATKADVVGRVATGGMFFYGASLAYEAGALTGGGPKDPERRNLMKANGWQPYSIQVGDTYYSYRRLDPFASFLGTVADLNEAMAEADPKDRKTIEGVLGALVFSTARNVTNKSYLTGLSRISNVLSNPERFGQNYLEQTISSFVPFSSATSQTLGASEHEKEIRSVIDAIRAKYGLDGQGTGLFAGQVEDRRNIFGEKIDRAKTIGPVMYTTVKDDEVMQELNILGHGFSPPKTVYQGVDTTAYRNNQGQTFYDRWQENHGQVRVEGRTLKQAIKKLIKTRAYQQLPIEDFEGNRSPRIDAIDKIKRKYRTKAWEQTLSEFPEVRRLTKRNQTIKAYRRAGRDIQSLLDF